MKIYFVRHGQCNSNVKFIFNYKDEDIDEVGIEQAENLRKEMYLVEFDTNGGSMVDAAKVKAGTTLEVPDTPTKTHAEFNGWYSDKELTKEYDFSSLVWHNMTLYARWIPYHLVKFITIGGTEVEDQYIKDGFNATDKETTKEGYTFDGWYIDSEYTKKFDFSSIITEDTYLYARWI